MVTPITPGYGTGWIYGPLTPLHLIGDDAVRLITAPAEEPLTLAEAKAQARVETSFTDDDALLTSLITAARLECESRQSRALITQTWELLLTGWPVEPRIRLPRPPLISVTWIKYLDTSGTEQTLDTSQYKVRTGTTGPGIITPARNVTFPALSDEHDNITIRFDCGYGAAADVPESTKQAMRLLIAHWYENREAVLTGTISKEIEFAVDSLLATEDWGRYA